MSIRDDGTVDDVTVKTSGSTVFDADVTAAARRASPVPAPPPPARARAAAGVCFNFCPTSCN
jgi:TonB family protein